MLKIQNPLYNGFFIVLVAFSLFKFQGCNSNPNNPDGSTVSISFSTNVSLNKTILTSIELDTIKILIRDVKLETDSDSSDNDFSFGMHAGPGSEYRSENIKVGPFVIYLNLNGITTDFAVNDIPAGSYNEIKFKIHQIKGSEVTPDPEFKEGNDESHRYSVIVKGKYNSAPFIYKSRKSAHQKIRLDSLLVVQENSVTNLSVSVDPAGWFMDGQTELDPTDSSNASIIDNNIAQSFKSAFKDDDHDGKCDDNHCGSHHH